MPSARHITVVLPPPPPPLLCSCTCARACQSLRIAQRRRAQWTRLSVNRDDSSQHLPTRSAQRRGVCALWRAARSASGRRGARSNRRTRLGKNPQRAQMRGEAPLTLVGSPPRIHLLQREFGTMDPWLKFAGRRTGKKKAARRAEDAGAETGCRGRSGGEPRDAWTALPFSPGYRSKTTRRGLRLRTAVIPKWS